MPLKTELKYDNLMANDWGDTSPSSYYPHVAYAWFNFLTEEDLDPTYKQYDIRVRYTLALAERLHYVFKASKVPQSPKREL